MPNTNRNAGNAYERELAREFRELGFADCVTSRSESKRRDDEGVDLCNTGCLNVQAKRWNRSFNCHEILKAMPVEAGQHNVIIHRRPRQGDVVVMAKADFYELVQTLKKEGIWK